MVSPYENKKELKRDFSYSEVEIMIKILNLKVETTYESKIARKLGFSPQRLSGIISYLKKIKVISNGDVIGSVKNLKIDRKKLKHFIDEQDCLTWVVDNYHKKYNKFDWKAP